MTEAYIYDAVRTPRGKGRPDGSLHEVTSVRLSAQVLNALKERNGLEGHAVEDVIWGNVTQVGEQGGCLARTAVLASDLDQSIPGLAINRFCASGMEAVNLAANQVRGARRLSATCMIASKYPSTLPQSNRRPFRVTASTSPRAAWTLMASAS
mgnify:CR=1 FL=1